MDMILFQEFVGIVKLYTIHKRHVNHGKRLIVMNNPSYVELYKKAIDKWGDDFQLKMVAEECAELIKAVLKMNRKLNGYTIEQVIDEIADVQIMLGQLEVILESYNKFNVRIIIEQKIEEKMKRLEGMLNVKE